MDTQPQAPQIELLAQPPKAESELQPYQPSLWRSALGWWRVLKPKQQFAIVGGTAFSLILAGLLIPSFTSTKPATVEPPKAVTANDEAVLTASKQTLQATEQNTALVVNDARAALLSQESARLTQVAAAQVSNPRSTDYRQKPEQVLDRLESEAIAQYQKASTARDWSTAMAALTRVDAIDIARSGGNTTPEPKTSLTALALQTRLEKRLQVRSASADALASDVLTNGGKKR
jgi:hypothetical protein